MPSTSVPVGTFPSVRQGCQHLPPGIKAHCGTVRWWPAAIDGTSPKNRKLLLYSYYIVNKYMVIIWLLYGFQNRLIYAYYMVNDG